MNKHWKQTSDLRWASRPYQASTEYYGGGTVAKHMQVLQQAFMCEETGEVEWRDVPHTTPVQSGEQQ